MAGPTISLWTADLVLIFLIFLSLAAASLIWSLFWKYKNNKDIKPLRSAIRQLASEGRQLDYKIKNLLSGDSGSFTSQVMDCKSEAAEINARIHGCELDYVTVMENYHQLENRGRRRYLLAPRGWFQIHQAVRHLTIGVHDVQSALSALKHQIEDIEKQDLDPTQQLQEIIQLFQKASDLLDLLQNRNLSGDQLDNAQTELSECSEIISGFPQEFNTEHTEIIASEKTGGYLSNMLQILSDTHLRLTTLIDQAENWNRETGDLDKKVNLTHHKMDRVDHLFNTLPQKIDVSNHKIYFMQMKAVFENLEVSTKRLEIRQLKKFHKETDHLYRSVSELEDRLKNAHLQYRKLVTMLGGIQSGIQTESSHFVNLGTARMYPIDLDASIRQLSRIDQDFGELGTTAEKRSLEILPEHLDKASKLNIDLNKVSSHRQEIEAWHNELVSIMSTPEFKESNEWLSEARSVNIQVNKYAPYNFSRTGAVARLKTDLDDLEKEFLRLLPDEPPTPISETELQKFLKEAQNLDSSFKEMRLRVERFRLRLTELHQMVSLASQELQSAISIFNQIKIMTSENHPFVEIIAGENLRLIENAERLSQEWSFPHRGSIDKKYKQTNSFVTRAISTTNQWMTRIDTQIEDELTRVAGSLKNLDAIAHLDESAVRTARQLLDASRERNSYTGRGKSLVPLEKIPIELQKRENRWQSLIVVIQNLEKIEIPIQNVYTLASRSRQSAHQQYQELTKISGSKAAHKEGISEAIGKQLSVVDASWEKLLSETTQAKLAITRLTELSAGYQSVDRNLQTELERLNKEKSRISNLDRRLDDTIEAWLALQKTHRQNKIASQGIQRLTEDAKRKRRQFHNAYRQGEISEDELNRQLIGLRELLGSTRIKFDQSHLLDVNGKIHGV